MTESTVGPGEDSAIDAVAVIRCQDFARLVEREAIPSRQSLESNGDFSVADTLRRRPPLAPLRVAVVEEQPLDDHGEKRPQLATRSKLSQHRVVVVDEAQVHLSGEIVRIDRREQVPSCDRSSQPLDRGQLREKEALPSITRWYTVCGDLIRGGAVRTAGQRYGRGDDAGNRAPYDVSRMLHGGHPAVDEMTRLRLSSAPSAGVASAARRLLQSRESTAAAQCAPSLEPCDRDHKLSVQPRNFAVSIDVAAGSSSRGAWKVSTSVRLGGAEATWRPRFRWRCCSRKPSHELEHLLLDSAPRDGPDALAVRRQRCESNG